MPVTRRETLLGIAANAMAQEQKRIRLVVLDVGGTLIEDRGDVPAAMKAALEGHGVKADPEEIAKRRGAAKREVIAYFVGKKEGLSRDAREALVSRIHAQFSEKIIEAYKGVPPIPGVDEALTKLKADGYLLAATTGFDRAIAASIFGRLGWENRFAAVVSSEDVAAGRPAPYMIFRAMERARVEDVREVAVVGDTPLDVRSGRNAGVAVVVGVLSGAGTRQSLEKEGPTRVVKSVADVPALLSSLGR